MMDIRRWSSISGVLAVVGLMVTACDQEVEEPIERIHFMGQDGDLVIDAHVSPEHEDAIVELAEEAWASFPEEPLEAAAPECTPDHVVTVTETNSVCDGDIMCACFDAQGNFSVHGPLQLGQQCNVPPGGACAPTASPPFQSCAVAEASTEEPSCPANCTPMGGVTVNSAGGPPNCCTATKSLDCCCPGDAQDADEVEPEGEGEGEGQDADAAE